MGVVGATKKEERTTDSGYARMSAFMCLGLVLCRSKLLYSFRQQAGLNGGRSVWLTATPSIASCSTSIKASMCNLCPSVNLNFHFVFSAFRWVNELSCRTEDDGGPREGTGSSLRTRVGEDLFHNYNSCVSCGIPDEWRMKMSFRNSILI